MSTITRGAHGTIADYRDGCLIAWIELSGPPPDTVAVNIASPRYGETIFAVPLLRDPGSRKGKDRQRYRLEIPLGDRTDADDTPASVFTIPELSLKLVCVEGFADTLPVTAVKQAPELTSATSPMHGLVVPRPVMQAVPPRFIGRVESWAAGSLSGWAWDRSQPDAPVELVLYDGDEPLVRWPAATFRKDLMDKGMGNGRHAFTLSFPESLLFRDRHVFRVKIADAEIELDGSPHVYRQSVPILDWSSFVAITENLRKRIADTDEIDIVRSAVGMMFAMLGEALPKFQEMQARNPQAEDEIFDLAHSYSAQIGDLLSQMRKKYPRITLNTSDTPEVSVIIPVYGKFAYTYQCLKSIFASEPKLRYEVIVVDDCSVDETVFLTAVTAGVRFLRPQQNGGFIESCNAGAAIARGRYLHFFNNDTEVRPGWLDELHDTFAAEPRAGLVGSKLIYPDGKLQEAGGIIWRMGDGWNVGRGQDPAHPHANYRRQVDYCSGASIMIPTDLFNSFGGFDAIYKPAYYEDTDLAFKVRQAGRRVYYQPLSVIVHHEGISSGTDVKTGVKRYQIRNSRLFFDRWKTVLASHRLNGDEPHLEKDRGIVGRALFIDETTPTPKEDAGSTVAISHMRILQELGYHVTFVPADNMANLGAITSDLQRMGVECVYAPYYWSLEELLRKRAAEFDLVYIHRYVNAFKYLPVLRTLAPRAKVIYCVADLHSLRLNRQAEMENSPTLRIEAAQVKMREYQAISGVDYAIVHSDVERDLLARELPDAKVAVIPWTVERTPAATSFAQRKNIAFIGGYRHPPNVDAVEFFVTEILPPLVQLVPDVKFLVIGSHLPDRLRQLAASNVQILGFVSDLGPILADVKLTVAPMRFGAGIKGKIFTSLAHGVPCVATAVSAEGMGLTDGKDIAIATPPMAIARAIARLYLDEELWRAQSEAGLLYLKQDFTLSANVLKFKHFMTLLDLPVAE